MIMLTEPAANRIKKQIEKRGKGLGIRIAVRTSGCSGLAYALEFVDEPFDDDIIIESNGCLVYVDPKSFVHVNDTIIDFVRKGLNEGFDFINPLEKSRCGCGESFHV